MIHKISVGNVTVKTDMLPGDFAARAVPTSSEGYVAVLNAIHDAIKDDREKIAKMLEQDGYYTLARNVRELS